MLDRVLNTSLDVLTGRRPNEKGSGLESLRENVLQSMTRKTRSGGGFEPKKIAR